VNDRNDVAALTEASGNVLAGSLESKWEIPVQVSTLGHLSEEVSEFRHLLGQGILATRREPLLLSTSCLRSRLERVLVDGVHGSVVYHKQEKACQARNV
jgi:hypothetical protein